MIKLIIMIRLYFSMISSVLKEHMYIRWLSEEGVTRISSIQRDLYKAGINVSEAQYLFDRVPITCIVFSSNRRQVNIHHPNHWRLFLSVN